ncbi:MAG: rRNA maturation RNase YbeY [Acidobacteriia bacterium]|nr:rRNA maturation RNase YbeY [Terriglobia bacterium]
MPLFNRQRRVRIDVRHFYPFLKRLAETLGHAETDVTITLVSDRTIQTLNRRFRGKDRPTDVLSFPADRDGDPWKHVAREETSALGEIIISAETARRQADEEGHSVLEEIKLLIIHGALHLEGFDHESDGGEMNQKEYALRARLL